MKIQNYPYLI